MDKKVKSMMKGSYKDTDRLTASEISLKPMSSKTLTNYKLGRIGITYKQVKE